MLWQLLFSSSEQLHLLVTIREQTVIAFEYLRQLVQRANI